MIRKILTYFILTCFFLNDCTSASFAQTTAALPGSAVQALPGSVEVPVLAGLKVYADNPFRFDFIVESGAVRELEAESSRLIKYFLAGLTVPEQDLWVNLSPYEKDRIIPDAFGQTEMGRTLLEQDYLLKQITANMIHPDSPTGKEFWKKVYAAAFEKYGTTDIPVDTFNKVWIVPERAVVYENGTKAGAIHELPVRTVASHVGAIHESPDRSSVAYVVESRLKVMLERDYLLEKTQDTGHRTQERRGGFVTRPDDMSQDILREVVIPVLENEVNDGEVFAPLRQVYQSMILAEWYKRRMKESLLAAVYIDKNKVSGVNSIETDVPEKIWSQYAASFKKGAYNLIKEEHDAYSDETIPRHYMSGGMNFAEGLDQAMMVTRDTGWMRTLGRSMMTSALLVTISLSGVTERVAFGAGVSGQVGPKTAVSSVKSPQDLDSLVTDDIRFVYTFTKKYLRAVIDGQATLSNGDGVAMWRSILEKLRNDPHLKAGIDRILADQKLLKEFTTLFFNLHLSSSQKTGINYINSNTNLIESFRYIHDLDEDTALRGLIFYLGEALAGRAKITNSLKLEDWRSILQPIASGNKDLQAMMNSDAFVRYFISLFEIYINKAMEKTRETGINYIENIKGAVSEIQSFQQKKVRENKSERERLLHFFGDPWTAFVVGQSKENSLATRLVQGKALIREAQAISIELENLILFLVKKSVTADVFADGQQIMEAVERFNESYLLDKGFLISLETEKNLRSGKSSYIPIVYKVKIASEEKIEGEEYRFLHAEKIDKVNILGDLGNSPYHGNYYWADLGRLQKYAKKIFNVLNGVYDGRITKAAMKAWGEEYKNRSEQDILQSQLDITHIHEKAHKEFKHYRLKSVGLLGISEVILKDFSPEDVEAISGEMFTRLKEIAEGGYPRSSLGEMTNILSSDVPTATYFASGAVIFQLAGGEHKSWLTGNNLELMTSRVFDGSGKVLADQARNLLKVLFVRKDSRDNSQASESMDSVTRDQNNSYGGIDLNPLGQSLDIQGNGAQGWRYNVDPAMIEKYLREPGFVPVMLDIQPIDNMLQFLGL